MRHGPPSAREYVTLQTKIRPTARKATRVISKRLEGKGRSQLIIHSLRSIPSRDSATRPARTQEPSNGHRVTSGRRGAQAERPITARGSHSPCALGNRQASGGYSTYHIDQHTAARRTARPPPRTAYPDRNTHDRTTFPATATAQPTYRARTNR